MTDFVIIWTQNYYTGKIVSSLLSLDPEPRLGSTSTFQSRKIFPILTSRGT